MEELEKCIWHAFTALSDVQTGYVQKSKLKVSIFITLVFFFLLCFYFVLFLFLVDFKLLINNIFNWTH